MAQKPPLNDYVRYSGMAMQMGITIAIFAYLGVYLDNKYALNPVFTLIGSLLGVGIALYVVLKNFV